MSKILPVPRPKKILARALYEVMWGAPHRDYGKRVNGGKKNENKKSK